jgi:hypothetical protein
VKDFSFKPKQHIHSVKICGKVYDFNCSPTNWSYVKKVSDLSREVQKYADEFNALPKDTLFDIEKAFDFLKDKEKAVIEAVLPGKFDELFEASGHDVLDMVDLIAFITDEIKSAGAQAKKEAVQPVEAPADAQAV